MSDLNFENILVELSYQNHENVALVRLNRPKVLNALSTHLLEDLAMALWELDKREEVRVIILTGNEKAFAAGADIKQMAEAGPFDHIRENRMKYWDEISKISKPVIAAVQGYALGGGLELCMSCDLIIAGDRTKVGQPEISIGTIPGAGGTQRLTRAIGKAKAMKMVLTGEMISSQKAYDWGLVSEVVPEETVMQESFEIAKKIASMSPIATRLAKESINTSFEVPLQKGLDFERRQFFLTFASEDQKEGMKAFLEKREANYSGR